MTGHTERRLLSVQEIAAKLGRSKSWLTDNLTQLENRGFPKPVLGGGHGSPKRWDNHAIDLWLDSLMPAELKSTSDRPVKTAMFDAMQIERDLMSRARSLSL